MEFSVVFSKISALCKKVCPAVLFVVLATNTHAEEAAEGEMSLATAAQKTNNPVSDAWLLITQNDLGIYETPDGGTEILNATTAQPVMPIPILDGKWNLVNRVVTGFVSSPVKDNFTDPNFFDGRTNGWTDTIVFSLAAPDRDDGFIWGVGPTVIAPTASDDVLGDEKWSAGPAALAVRLGNSHSNPRSIESWNIGLLAQHWWDFAGDDDRADVNRTNIQYFVNYKKGPIQLVGMTPNIVINWEESGSDRFSVPIGIGTIGFWRWGSVPVRWGLELQHYVMRPDDAFTPEWNLKFFLAPVAANPFK